MLYDNVNEVVIELFESFLSRYQFFQDIFYSVQLLYYNCHKIDFKRGRSYIDSPDWIKKKKTTLNLKN